MPTLDIESATKNMNFTDNIDTIREAIRNTEPDGGDDTAKDVEFALDLFVKKILFNRVVIKNLSYIQFYYLFLVLI